MVTELGYASNPTARGMRIPRTGVIGILVRDIEPYRAEVLVCAAAGRRVDRWAGSTATCPGCPARRWTAPCS